MLFYLRSLPTDSDCPAAVDISDILIVPAAAVILNVNGVHAIVGLPACCSWLYYFCQFSCFCWRPCCDGGPVVAFIPAVICVPAVAGGSCY